MWCAAAGFHVTAMPRERNTLPSLPKLGLGTAAIGRPGYINLGRDADLRDRDERTREFMRENAHHVLDEAVRLGLRYVDCARSYGDAESFVASWLAQSGAATSGVVVGSKWGYEYTANWRVEVGAGEAHEVKYHTAAQLAKQLAESRENLPSLALYQIHSATEASGVLENEEVLDALAALRDSGVVCGVSVSHPQRPSIRRAIEVARGGGPLFGSVQATFNLLDQSAAAELAAAHEAGMCVIVKEALANGRLTERAPDSDKLALLREEAAALGTGVDALALAWVISHPWVTVCLSGASTVEQLRSNADALRIAPLDPALHARLSAAVRQECDEYWEDRKALQWN